MWKGLGIVVLLAVAGTASAGAATAPATSPATTPTTMPHSPMALVESLGEGYRPYLETHPAGQIDWTRGHILARGVGKGRGSGAQAVAMARRAARLIAGRNAVLLISGVAIDSDGRFPNIQRGRISVEGVLRDFEETSVDYDPRGRTVTITLKVPLHGQRSVVKMIGPPAARRASRWSWPAAEKPPGERVDVVVIDARSTKFTPVLFPRLQSPSGQGVLEAADLPKDQLLRRCLVVYASRLRPPGKAAPLSFKTAIRPLILRPTRSKGKDKVQGTLVLSDADLKKLSKQGEARQLMKAGKVVILVREQR